MEVDMLYSPAPMHIPDGFLSVAVSVILWLIIIPVIAYALRRVSTELDERKIPLMGVLAAAIFAGQMLNFAVAGGTSGHLMGAAIATILLGPWAAALVMTVVVSVQALIFQDGGLLVLGANIFNMAVIGVAVSYAVYQTFQRLARSQKWGIFVGGFVAAWLSIEIAALAAALELALSGTSPANIAILAMGGIHALIGIGEGLITVGALAFIYASRPDLLDSQNKRQGSSALVWIVGLLIAVALTVLSPLASAHPDGLEWVAKQNGFLQSARNPAYNIIPDYILPGISNEALATILAGIIGVLLVFGSALAIAYLRRTRQSTH
jgi:cobalt/nickel transport system permease protein